MVFLPSFSIRLFPVYPPEGRRHEVAGKKKVTGEDVPRFMDMALRDAHAYRELIGSCLDMENGDVERATATMVRVEYDEKESVYRERNACVANVTAQVKAVAVLRGRIDNGSPGTIPAGDSHRRSGSYCDPVRQPEQEWREQYERRQSEAEGRLE